MALAGLLRILHVDSSFVVISKPSGLLCVPGRQPLICDAVTLTRNWLLTQFPEKSLSCSLLPTNDPIFKNHARLAATSSPDIYGIRAAHRLDMATSGVVAFATTGQAHSVLSHMLFQHTPLRLPGGFSPPCIIKRYIAVVDARLAIACGYPITVQNSGVIRTPLQRHSHVPLLCEAAPGADLAVDTSLAASTAEATKVRPCETRWRVLERHAGTIRIEMEPVTGRTHQLRLHAALPPPFGLGCPVVGDPVYGDPALATSPYLMELVSRYGATASPEDAALGSVASHLLRQQQQRFAVLAGAPTLEAFGSVKFQLPSPIMYLHAEELIIPDWEPPPLIRRGTERAPPRTVSVIPTPPPKHTVESISRTSVDSAKWSVADARGTLAATHGCSVDRVQVASGALMIDAVRFFHAAPF